MSLTKTLAGIVAFAIALGAAVVITRHYAPPPARTDPPAPVASAPAPEAPPPPAVGAPGITHEAQLITLDFDAKRSHTTLALERDPARPAPERLWVRTYLFTKDGAPAAAGYAVCGGLPVEVRRPFAEGNRKTLTVTASAAKCREPSDPAATYYARVKVSAESPGAAELGALPENYNISAGSPVVLQKGSGGTR